VTEVISAAVSKYDSQPDTTVPGLIAEFTTPASTVHLSNVMAAKATEKATIDFRCEKCKAPPKENGQMVKSVVTWPSVLILRPMRTVEVGSAMTITKNHVPIVLPPVLEVANYVYDIYALAVNDGGLGGSHYMSYIRQKNKF